MFYLQAVTCPAVDVSHIMLEAYKKFILVSLILHGKVRNDRANSLSVLVHTSNSYNLSIQSNLDYPDLDYPDFSIIRTFSLVPFFFMNINKL